LQEVEAMDTRCTCAEARAKHAAEEIDRLQQQLESKRRQFREQCDISDTWRIQKEEVRRLLDEERDSRLSLLVTISEGITREDAMRELRIIPAPAGNAKLAKLSCRKPMVHSGACGACVN